MDSRQQRQRTSLDTQINQNNRHHLSFNSIDIGNTNNNPHQQQNLHLDDDNDRILFNLFLAKYNSQQTQQEDQLYDVDQNEDQDIRLFLEQQIPGLYDKQQPIFQQNLAIDNHKISSTFLIDLNSNNGGSLCVEYLSMNRWQKESFFDSLNQIYMRRMQCGRDNSNNKKGKINGRCKRGQIQRLQDNKANSITNGKQRKRGIKFNQIVSEVVFNKEDEPSVVGRTEQEAGVIVFDDQAYEVESHDESDGSDSCHSDYSDSNSESESESDKSSSNSNSNSSNSENSNQYIMDSRDISSSQSPSPSPSPQSQQQNINNFKLITSVAITPVLQPTNDEHNQYNQQQLQQRMRKRLSNGSSVMLSNSQHMIKDLMNKDSPSQSIQQINGRKLLHKQVDNNSNEGDNVNVNNMQSSYQRQQWQQLIVLQKNHSTSPPITLDQLQQTANSTISTIEQSHKHLQCQFELNHIVTE